VRISCLTVGAFQENCYLLVDTATSHAVLIDPGEEGLRIVAAVEAASVQLQAIWVTHAHLDHVGGIAEVKRHFDVPIFLHADDLTLYGLADRQAAAYGLPFDTPPLPEREFIEGQALELGTLRFSVLHAPGHAPGHVVIHGQGVAFCGDCVFAGSIGRTDLPMSDGRRLTRSLERIAELPGRTVLYPGHGPETTLERELVSNPFLNGTARIVGA
jgi:glyoxylase-like metal-dependent hydrolase (beta-lactamase superfamily II)